MRIIFKLCLVLLFTLIIQPAWSKSSDLSVTDFFKNPAYSGLQLSPDGKHTAVIMKVGNRRNIVIVDTDGFKNPRAVTGLTEQDVGSFIWANNKDILMFMDSDGNEAFSIFKIDTSAKKPIIDTLVSAIISNSGVRAAQLVHTLPNDPERVIVSYNYRRILAPDLYKLPLDSKWNSKREKNSKMELIQKNPGNVQQWILDHDGEVRGAVTIDGLKGELLYKSKGEKEFHVLRSFNVEDEGFTPIAFDFDNKTMFISSNINRDRSAIFRFDPETNKIGEMIYAHDTVDVSNLIMSRKQQKLLGVSYIDDYPETVYFDKATESMMHELKAAFPGKRVSISSRSDDELINIIMVNNDNDPGQYFLFDKNKNNVTRMVGVMDWLNPNDLSPMKPIQFTSRDGLTIRGYVTIPKDSNGKNLPLIVNPHGGPFGVRDVWGFNPEHQFFASRGYVTVQVNYRGSGGYGRKFQQAGYDGKWGAEMQNDLTDAVKYLVKEGIADPDKVCIYGSSYGGYATMAGLTFTPELYKCGINYVGVTDIGLLFDTMPKTWEGGRKVLEGRIGDPDDKELMKRMSPLAHVDKIKAPLMIVQGARDPRVVKQHATDLRDALEDRGIELTDDEWIMKSNEGHGFRKEENIIELYTKMEKFLSKHLN